jgi:hypothetical protein
MPIKDVRTRRRDRPLVGFIARWLAIAMLTGLAVGAVLSLL